MSGWLQRLRHRRNHPAPETLCRYLDDDLSAAEHNTVDQHVGRCISCQRMLQSLSETIATLGSLRVRPQSRLADRVIAALWSWTSEADARRLTIVTDTFALARTGRRVRTWPAVRYCLQRSQLRFTVPAGLLVGVVLSLVNHGGMLLHGEIDLAMCAACAADFLLPFVAMNVVMLTATRLAGGR